MAEESSKYHSTFQSEVKGAVVGEGNIIYNYFYSREEVKPVDFAIAVDEYLPCPYQGLFHFGPNEAEFFFGREIFIEELYSATKTNNFIPVLGASGSGKSSVVLAGLVPKLQKAGHWQFTHFRPGSDPFHAIALALVPLYTPDLDQTDQIAQARKMAGYLQDGSVPLSDVFAKIQQNHPNHRLLLIADQFEEIYTLCNNQEIRRKFLDCLLASLETPVSLSSSATVLVTTMRADFLGNALSYRPFADVLQNADLKLGPMNREELTEVIEKPAQKLGVTFETGLVERILDDVEDQPGNLPLLEFALTELWNKRSGKLLTHKIYEEIGQVEGALARHADEKYGNLTDDEKEKVRRIFIQLVRPGEGAEDTRRIAMKAELGEQSWSLVKKLADARLVVTSRNLSSQETVEVVHEALIRNWGELREWMNTSRVFRAWQERLRGAKGQWEATKQDPGSLLRGTALAEAEEKLKERPDDLINEKEFIEQSIQERDRLEKAEQARLERELSYLEKALDEEEKARQAERKVRKEAQIKSRWAIATTVLAIVALIILSFSALKQQQSWKTIESVFLGTDSNQIIKALPEFIKQANDKRNEFDKLPDGADPVRYYTTHTNEINSVFVYYRSILSAAYRLQQKKLFGTEKIKEDISNPAETSLAEMIHKYRIPELESYLKQKKFGNLKDETKSTDFENRFTEGALQTTYAILERESGAGADLNQNGLIDTPEEVNQIPCKTLQEIDELWQHYTNKHCGWLGDNDDLYQDSDCKLDQDNSTLTMLVIGVPNSPDVLESRIKQSVKNKGDCKDKFKL
ncbi:MAG TPA: hypothetical protein VE944_05550 [Nostoc sp.]|uniref:nSTAND1 domain-containing NTPase n=1 Tax=Nostoc sp. TaxID=1180 RepID=UPI002D72251C|nr:hypothetical protein [Nostoc sp.]HYX13829.1 hypothetical protein [Nostoc sp.]